MTSTTIESTRGWQREAFRRAYNQYATAMRRRRPGSELPEGAFVSYVQSRARVFRHAGSYIFGQLAGGIFKVTHFAPKSLRGGVEAVKALLDSEQATVLAVTADMAGMLEKLGYACVAVLPSNFRGEEVDKHLFTNNPALRAELRNKMRQIEGGFATAYDFSYLLDCASLDWAERKFGWANWVSNS